MKPTTGEVYVKNSDLLDRELRSLYTATLQALDSETKPGTTVLEITLTDINDKTPVMNRESYLEFVEEGNNVQVKIEVSVTTGGQDLLFLGVMVTNQFRIK